MFRYGHDYFRYGTPYSPTNLHFVPFYTPKSQEIPLHFLTFRPTLLPAHPAAGLSPQNWGYPTTFAIADPAVVPMKLFRQSRA
jgi:hypothetical protein